MKQMQRLLKSAHVYQHARGHMYYLIEWEGGSGWTRTYHPDPFPPKWEPVEHSSCGPGGDRG